jgi:hypothetical protein
VEVMGEIMRGISKNKKIEEKRKRDGLENKRNRKVNGRVSQKNLELDEIEMDSRKWQSGNSKQHRKENRGEI